MKILVPVKRVVDYNVKVRVKNLKVAVPLCRCGAVPENWSRRSEPG